MPGEGARRQSFEQFLGGRYALPRDAAMTNVLDGNAPCPGFLISSSRNTAVGLFGRKIFHAKTRSRKGAKKWRGVWPGARVVELVSARVARQDLFLCGFSTLRLCVIPFRRCGCRYGWEED
jgi:hypothetical protein